MIGSSLSGSVLGAQTLVTDPGHAVQYDRLDVTNVAFLELVSLRMVMIERVVRSTRKLCPLLGCTA